MRYCPKKMTDIFDFSDTLETKGENKMNLTLFMQVLPKAGLGWLGVFAVTIIIVAAVELLEHFTNRKK